jgi:hypothetical protein
MWAWNYLAVGIPVRRTAEIEPNQDNDLSRAVLVVHLGDVDLHARNIKQEVLALIQRGQRQHQPLETLAIKNNRRAGAPSSPYPPCGGQTRPDSAMGAQKSVRRNLPGA